MEKNNRMELDQLSENEVKVKKMGKMNVTDFLFMLAGVAIIAGVTILLAWILL